jgi:hypothetical protein
MVVVIISMSTADIMLPLPFTDDSENAVAITWLAARCAWMALISVRWMAIWVGL